jgi:predicted PurR-regulated permease PerM
VVAAAYLAGKLAYRLRDLILLFFVAGFVALILNPLVVVLQNWRIRRRGWAVAVVTLWGLLVFVGLAAAFGYPLVNGLTHLANVLPSYVHDAERGRGPIGHLVRKYHIQRWITDNEPKLVKIGQDLAKPALNFGKGAFSLLFALFLIFVLVLLLLLEGPKMRATLLRLMPPGRAERYGQIAGEINRAVGGYMLGNIATSLMAGTVVFLTLLLLGVPFALLWALWVALVDFLPMIGGALAGIPVVLFAVAHSLTAGIVTLAVFVIYTQIENHVLDPVVMSRTVKINPLLVLVSILIAAYVGSWIGGTFGAFVAALLAIPAAGTIQVLVREIWLATAPQPVPADPPDNEPPEVERAKQLRERRRRDLHGDLLAELGLSAQAQIVPAPEPARVIPVRPSAGRQQAHGLVGDGDDLRAVGGFQADLAFVPPQRRHPPAQPPGGEPGHGRKRGAIQPSDGTQQRILHGATGRGLQLAQPRPLAVPGGPDRDRCAQVMQLRTAVAAARP